MTTRVLNSSSVLPFSTPRVHSSKRIGPHNHFSSLISTHQNIKNLNLDPNWVTGFIDAEGYFIVLIAIDKNYKTGWTIKTRFSISLHKKDLAILELIKTYLGNVGNILKQGKDSVQYKVASLESITKVIIPHFDKYPLITQKKADYELWKRVIEIVSCKGHLTTEGLQ